MENYKEKKRFPLQTPVIIALCIVLASVLAYLGFTAFLLREPEGVTWATEINDVTYYIDFNSDGTYNGYLGSVEFIGNYTKDNIQQTDGASTADQAVTGKVIALDSQFAYFQYPNYPVSYTITGSRLLGNQKMDCSYGAGNSFTFYQSKREAVNMPLPKDFEPDQNLVGTWVLSFADQELQRITFNANGSVKIESPQVIINGTYTISNGEINLTYQGSKDEVFPSKYEIKGDTLTYMDTVYVREGSGATVDQPFLTMQENQEETKAEAKSDAKSDAKEESK